MSRTRTTTRTRGRLPPEQSRRSLPEAGQASRAVDSLRRGGKPGRRAGRPRAANAARSGSPCRRRLASTGGRARARAPRRAPPPAPPPVRQLRPPLDVGAGPGPQRALRRLRASPPRMEAREACAFLGIFTSVFVEGGSRPAGPVPAAPRVAPAGPGPAAGRPRPPGSPDVGLILCGRVLGPRVSGARHRICFPARS